MRSRHAPKRPVPLPKLWLMTDERMGDALLRALWALPRGSGVVFRHYSLPQCERRALFKVVRRLAKARRLVISLAGPAPLAVAWKAHGSHGRHRGALTAPVHSIPERVAAERSGAALIFVSPLFATASHPGGRALGRLQFGNMVRGAKAPIIALGGMTKQRARAAKGLGIYGWAAIDGLMQKPR